MAKSLIQQDNAAKIEGYNLSQITRKKLALEESIVNLQSEYRSNQGLVFLFFLGQGTFCQVSSIRDKTDIISKIQLV